MKKKDIAVIKKLIDDYLDGKLDSDETDKLWTLLLEYPEYYYILKTEAALRKKKGI